MHPLRLSLVVFAALALGLSLVGCVTESARTGPVDNQALDLPFGPFGPISAPTAWQKANDADPAGSSAPFSSDRNSGYFPNSQ